jgi:short subunit fatty acids transporter
VVGAFVPTDGFFIVLLAAGWLIHEFATKDTMIAISSLNRYNFLFIMLGMLLHVGFTLLQLLVHLPLVLFLLWALAYTLEYHPPVIP